MNRRRMLILAAMTIIALAFSGCSGLQSRRVAVVIPNHPWEEAGGLTIWHDLEIHTSEGIENCYIGPGQRTVDVVIPLGEPVIVLAYPLGQGSPFGAWLSPGTGDTPVMMTQMDGVLLENFCRVDGCWNDLNYEKLASIIVSQTSDYRQPDRMRLLEDAANGRLKESSVLLREKIEVKDLEIPSGLWHPEFARDGNLYVSRSQEPSIRMYPGTVRYYNFQLRLMLSIHVKEDGSFESSISEGLIN
ncbi:MAG: hypothetical protein PHT39_02080 [Sphaerochaetaceae bacterium]|jgi:hypothetical protein|nr:hypothetical protein [Sphaerochaetaceae bacterium]